MSTLFELGLVFVEGLALIVSPCILPILPLILAASVVQGRKRPYGIIVGFVLSFSLFVLLARQLIQSVGIEPDWLKSLSLVLLALFALLLWSERLGLLLAQLSQGLAGRAQQWTAGAGDGWWSGVYIGSLIGLVWTPCAGPILASVLVQIVRQQSDWTSLMMVLTFALGAAVPMLLIALGGRQLLTRAPALLQHGQTIRRLLAVLMLVAVAYMAWGDRWGSASIDNTPPPAQASQLVHGLEKSYPAPTLAPGGTWLNSAGLPDLTGKVVLIDFWTYSCINCVRTLPYLKDWHQKYRDQGLVIIGVHAPEFEFEKQLSNVQAAVSRHGITYPVVQDNAYQIWDQFKNRYWPAHYLIDRNGQVVYTHFGEGQYQITENNIRYLLGLAPQASSQADPQFTPQRTPETYLGYERGRKFASPEDVWADKTQFYHFPTQLTEDQWALQGEWQIQKQRSVSVSAQAGLKLKFRAKKVFLVLGKQGAEPIQLNIKLNQKLQRTLTVDQHQLYTLLDLPQAQVGELELQAQQAGLEIYAFTFE